MLRYLGKILIAFCISLVGALYVNSLHYSTVIAPVKKQLSNSQYLVDMLGFTISTIAILMVTDFLCFIVSYCDIAWSKQKKATSYNAAELNEILSNYYKNNP